MGALEFKGSDFTRIVEMTPELRRQIEATVEQLISLLDEYDGDPDLELDDSDDEPSLGWVYSSDGTPRPRMVDGASGGSDRELEPEHDEDGGDLEPTLGAPERHPDSWEFLQFGVVCREPGRVRVIPEKSQEHWADGGLHVDECEDCPDSEDEDGWSEQWGQGPKINPVGEFMKLT